MKHTPNLASGADFDRAAAQCMSVWEAIPANVLRIDDREARLIEITENLHRAELSALERSEQVAEWVRLTEPNEVSGQLDQKPQGGRPESGVSKASRDLGIERMEVRRSIKVASLTDEAKAEAKPRHRRKG